MKPLKAELENRFGVPVYTGWHLVPKNLHARNFYKTNFGIVIPEDAKPDAIKGGGKTTGGKGYYLLFDENKYLSGDEKI
ncbi:MAG: hypothetical protein LUM44_17730 [Pyrinomonadaceae bacterium]|nr:hypothetical protein [Pyrinomonadaceae bacterium]